MIRTLPHAEARYRRAIPCALLLLALLISSGSLSAQTTDTTDIKILGGCWIDEGAERFSIFLVAGKILSAPIVVRLHFDGTATSADHGHVDTTVVIPKGARDVAVRAPMIDDDHAEPVESVVIDAIVLEGAGRMFNPEPTVIYILDNDAPVNLLVDPGFEDGGSAWTSEAPGGVTTSTENVSEGVRSLMLEASTQEVREVHQDVEVVPGMTYLFRLDLSGEELDVDVPVAEVIWFDAAHEEIGRRVMASSSLPGAGFTGVRGCLIAPDNATSARFRLSIPIEPDGVGAIWFDNLGMFPSGTSSDAPADGGDVRRLDLSLDR